MKQDNLIQGGRYVVVSRENVNNSIALEEVAFVSTASTPGSVHPFAGK